jgi:cytochrome c peroxidase
MFKTPTLRNVATRQVLANLDTDVPFDGPPVGGTPHMTTQNVADLQCFLETLTDGYVQGVTPQDPNCVN